jgi:hypothetical protein
MDGIVLIRQNLNDCQPERFLMDNLKEKTVVVYDYGNNISLADRLSREFGRVLLYVPWEMSMPESTRLAVGDGIERVERVLDFFDPEVLKSDLFVFPDIYDGDLQEDLVSRGKRVWGARSAEDYEYKRELFSKTLKEVGLLVSPYKVIVGTMALKRHLMQNKDLWIKVEMRGDGETWHHENWPLSRRKMEALEYKYGPIKELIRFTVCESISTTTEVAYDGFMVTSPAGLPQFSNYGFLGYEDKSMSHILTATLYDEFPEEAKTVNEKFAPKLAERMFRSAWGTEIKIADDGNNYFLDATCRQPEPPGSIIMEMVKNIGEFMYHGADGNLVDLEIEKPFGVQVMLYSAWAKTNWLTVDVPDEIKRWVKLYNYCECDGSFQVVPDEGTSRPDAIGNEQVGSVVGLGETIADAIDAVKENCESVEGFDVTKQIESLMEGLRRIHEGENHGIEFADEVPEPESVME